MIRSREIYRRTNFMLFRCFISRAWALNMKFFLQLMSVWTIILCSTVLCDPFGWLCVFFLLCALKSEINPRFCSPCCKCTAKVLRRVNELGNRAFYLCTESEWRNQGRKERQGRHRVPLHAIRVVMGHNGSPIMTDDNVRWNRPSVFSFLSSIPFSIHLFHRLL